MVYLVVEATLFHIVSDKKSYISLTTAFIEYSPRVWEELLKLGERAARGMGKTDMIRKKSEMFSTSLFSY